MNQVVGEHHQINGHESEQILGAREGQVSLACCNPWGQSMGSQRIRYNLVTEQHEPRKLRLVFIY